MESKRPSFYYRLELDDYSAAAFTSFGKYYYGTLDEIRDFIDELCSNEDFGDRFVELISAFHAFEAGQHDVKHNVAYRDVPLLVPVRLLYKPGRILIRCGHRKTLRVVRRRQKLL